MPLDFSSACERRSVNVSAIVAWVGTNESSPCNISLSSRIDISCCESFCKFEEFASSAIAVMVFSTVPVWFNVSLSTTIVSVSLAACNVSTACFNSSGIASALREASSSFVTPSMSHTKSVSALVTSESSVFNASLVKNALASSTPCTPRTSCLSASAFTAIIPLSLPQRMSDSGCKSSEFKISCNSSFVSPNKSCSKTVTCEARTTVTSSISGSSSAICFTVSESCVSFEAAVSDFV